MYIRIIYECPISNFLSVPLLFILSRPTLCTRRRIPVYIIILYLYVYIIDRSFSRYSSANVAEKMKGKEKKKEKRKNSYTHNIHAPFFPPSLPPFFHPSSADHLVLISFEPSRRI